MSLSHPEPQPLSVSVSSPVHLAAVASSVPSASAEAEKGGSVSELSTQTHPVDPSDSYLSDAPTAVPEIEGAALEAEQKEVKAFSASLAPLSAQERLAKFFERFKPEDIAFTSSFGVFSAGLIHLVSQVAPGSKVYFLDTGFHFQETLDFVQDVVSRVDLKLDVIRPATPKSQLFYSLGSEPYRSQPKRCCFINKVEPMQALLQQKKGWIAGVRRGQSDHRAAMEFVELTGDGKWKLAPILDWTKPQLYAYIEEHGLPLHPLFDKGYTSIGCAPCTQVNLNPNDERGGRWAGLPQTECGLHFI